MIKPVIGGDILSLEVTAEATNVYNREIQARLAGFGWSRCVSWYRTGGTGKIHALFPGSMTLFWWWLRAPNWTHYKVVTVGRWKPRGRFGPFLCGISAAVGLCLTVGVAGVAYLGWAQMSI
ncbi:hypothetical protein C8R43DRAFT_1027593 [Mycena crocata]|nr:hypothetical protein C8R43DRAFT_1027593 [Mycena crocata]